MLTLGFMGFFHTAMAENPMLAAMEAASHHTDAKKAPPPTAGAPKTSDAKAKTDTAKTPPPPTDTAKAKTDAPKPPPTPPAPKPAPPPTGDAKATASKAKSDETASADDSAGPAIKPELHVVSVQPTGLDTINLDSGGNWLEKRAWFKKAEQLFDEIRNEVKKASDLRMDFVHEVHGAGQKIDDFYESVNFDKGQVDELLKNVLAEVSQASFKRGGDLSDKERNLKSTIHTEQKEIEALGNDIKKIADFDGQIDKTMMQAFKIVDACRGLETKAWNAYKAIGSELDDKKARDSYYEIENSYKNIQQNVKYLQSTLLPYLKSKLVTPVEQVMTKIKSSIHSLDEKGINLNKLIKQDEQKDLSLEKQREQETEKQAEDKVEKSLKHKVDREVQEKEDEEAVARRKKAEEIHEKEEQIWYYKLFFEVRDAVRCVGCWVVNHARCITCWMFDYSKDVSEKAVLATESEVPPSLIDILKGVCCKITEIICMIFCYIKHLLCSLKAWFCHLIGY